MKLCRSFISFLVTPNYHSNLERKHRKYFIGNLSKLIPRLPYQGYLILCSVHADDSQAFQLHYKKEMQRCRRQGEGGLSGIASFLHNMFQHGLSLYRIILFSRIFLRTTLVNCYCPDNQPRHSVLYKIWANIQYNL